MVFVKKIEAFSSQIFNKQSRLSQDLLCEGWERVSAVAQKIFLSLSQFVVSSCAFILVAPCGLLTTNPNIKALAAVLFYHIKSGFRNFLLGFQGMTETPTNEQVLKARLSEEVLKDTSRRIFLEAQTRSNHQHNEKL